MGSAGLACRLGQRFSACCGKVAPGDPRPSSSHAPLARFSLRSKHRPLSGDSSPREPAVASLRGPRIIAVSRQYIRNLPVARHLSAAPTRSVGKTIETRRDAGFATDTNTTDAGDFFNEYGGKPPGGTEVPRYGVTSNTDR